MSDFKSTKIERTCETCQQTFYRYPADLRKGDCRFCSHDCYQIAPRRVTPIDVRFRRHVGPTNERGCQLWTGCRNANGYGNLKINGVVVSAHRVAWTIARGPIPDGLHVLHTCDTPACVTVAHLFLGTHADNMTDKNAKGRVKCGEDAGSKLTTAQVIEIRELYKVGGISIPQLATRFGIGRTTVHSIIHRRDWKHLP